MIRSENGKVNIGGCCVEELLSDLSMVVNSMVAADVPTDLIVKAVVIGTFPKKEFDSLLATGKYADMLMEIEIGD